MQVQDIMVREAKSCHPETNLAAATEIMWANNCGALPILDGGSKVVGIITDHDICMAVGTRNRTPSEIAVFEVKPKPQEVYTCDPGDDIHAALQTMRTRKVRRLPVVSNEGALRGILCLDDVALNARKRNGISYEDVAETLKTICEHHLFRQATAA